MERYRTYCYNIEVYPLSSCIARVAVRRPMVEMSERLELYLLSGAMYRRGFHALTRGRKYKQWHRRCIIQVRVSLSPPPRIAVQFLTTEVHSPTNRRRVAQSIIGHHIFTTQQLKMARICTNKETLACLVPKVYVVDQS